MKNQYFGDINDYRKYGLLRTLAGNGELKIAVCWMLTCDDRGSDGRDTDYASQPNRWGTYDPDLYDSLAQALKSSSDRNVSWAEQHCLIPSATYFPDLLVDNLDKRNTYFADLQTTVRDSDLIFFDPDNGIEVRSVPKGRKGSCKYLYWDELARFYASGKSLLVYQHFTREKRTQFIQRLVSEAQTLLHTPEVYTLRTSHVLFIVIPQPSYRKYLAKKCTEYSHQWNDQVNMEIWSLSNGISQQPKS